jgi:hypothetical protein
MGYATTRPAERVAAAMGALASAPIQFESASDVPKGGVLLALPALLAAGLLRHTGALYSLPNGFYGIASIFLLLALMALARIKSIEQLRYAAPGEWGNLLVPISTDLYQIWQEFQLAATMESCGIM